MKHRKVYLITSGLFLMIVLIGFSRTLYLSPYFESKELPLHLILHGIALTIWFLIAAIQPLLVLKDKIQVHKSLGIAGVATACAVVVLSLVTLVNRHIPLIDEFPNLAGPNLCSLFMFSICVVLGFKFRTRPAMHKRLMLLASMPLLAPALDRTARIPVLNEFFGKIFFWFPAPPEIAFATIGFLGLIASVIIYDLFTEKRVHAGTLWGLGGILIFAPAITTVVMFSGAWLALVQAAK